MHGVHPEGRLLCIPSPSHVSVKQFGQRHDRCSHTLRDDHLTHTNLSREIQMAPFTQDLLKLLARYHMRAKSLNPQGRKLKLANHWATMPTLQLVSERTFLSDR